ncbi:hypothetical protein WD019_03075 [Fictibacillus sp. Mic-4]|uniref:hypothetical protein n=1 Tax=Fictibacillus sp. Mic-4 TaxID=3132826 RepID=UPI003CE69005
MEKTYIKTIWVKRFDELEGLMKSAENLGFVYEIICLEVMQPNEVFKEGFPGPRYEMKLFEPKQN